MNPQRRPPTLSRSLRLHVLLPCLLGACLASARAAVAAEALDLHAAHEAHPGALAACFAPGTAEDYVAEIERRIGDNSLSAPLSGFQYTDGSRWSRTATNPGPLAQGDPTTITWSVVPDGTPIAATGNIPAESNDPSDLRAYLDAIYGSEAVWMPLFQQAFDRWSAQNGVTYVYEPNDDARPLASAPGQLGVRADVRISGHALDGPYNILAYNWYPSNGDMVIDTSDTLYGNTTNASRILRNVLGHEQGHGLGLRHVCPINQTKLLEPFLTTAFDGPQPDDVLATNRAYGDDLEPNDTEAAASDLGTLWAGETRTLALLSVDGTSDADLFRFLVGDGVSLTLTLTPLGSTYLSGPQQGACDSGSPFDALRVADLGVELRDSDGTTVLATANANPAGVVEKLEDVTLPRGAGAYYARVHGDEVNAAQLYRLDLTVSPAPDGPPLYEARSKEGIASPGNQAGRAGASPFTFVPAPDPLLYYQIDDGSGNPALIQMVKPSGGPGLEISYF